MKKIKFKELQKLDNTSLDQRLNEIKKELMKNNAQIATGTTPKSPGGIRQLKKNIARILTLKSQRELSSRKSSTKNE